MTALDRLTETLKDNNEIHSYSLTLWHQNEIHNSYSGTSGENNEFSVDKNTGTIIFSISKLIIAYCAVRYCVEQKIDLDTPISSVLPEFGKDEKNKITIRDLLCHQAKIPELPNGFDLNDFKKTYQLICELKPKEIKSFAYHPLTTGYILAEFFQKISKMNLESFCKANLSDIDFSFGLPEHNFENRFIHRYIPKVSSTVNGIDRKLMVEFFNQKTKYFVPAAGIFLKPSELIKFGQKILNEKNSQHIEQMLKPHSIGFDETLMIDLTWGLGFALSSNGSKFFGKGKINLAGHGGSSSHLFFLNLEKKYIACFLSDSHLSLPRSRKRDELIVDHIEEFIS